MDMTNQTQNREDNMNDISNCPSMELSNILPNGYKSFVVDLAFRNRRLTLISHDVFCETVTIASNHNLVKVLSDSSAGTICIKQIL